VRIAQVSPLFESVPPKNYGGTERVVSYLTEELVRQGHEVTLYATGDSVTEARLVGIRDWALRGDETSFDQMIPHVLELERVFQELDRFDIVHFHIDYLHFPLSRRMGEPHITTLHGRLDLPDYQPLYREFREMPLVSISDSQRGPLPFANWAGTVYHGLPRELYRFHGEPGKYLAFLGRFSPEKQPDQAIEIARQLGMPLKLAAKVDDLNQNYFDTVVKPLLDDDPLVHYVGEIGDRRKGDFLGNAYAFLFPIDWPEPFGLVMIEAMACGTPVIAYRRGSVPEVIEDGVTGFVVDSLEEAVEAGRKVATIDRRDVRRAFEERFTCERMAADYLKVYERIAAAARAPAAP
jgi:glycosyltransferase involved in cell wall biosynthesis